ncbi:hypothetical protein DIPPA_21602 [Diplonema papillatum]|nr:hypothetical protein DIPPA_15544 [Diplonema papillatum]KAJ9472816.1 hypothetical protein DIPPA_21602 [Diplonema papillatum]
MMSTMLAVRAQAPGTTPTAAAKEAIDVFQNKKNKWLGAAGDPHEAKLVTWYLPVIVGGLPKYLRCSFDADVVPTPEGSSEPEAESDYW